MRQVIATLLWLVVPIVLVAQKEEAQRPVASPGNVMIYAQGSPTTHNCKLTMSVNNGKEATLDFCGEEIVYSGTMPVSESAKIFARALWGEYRCAHPEPAKPCDGKFGLGTKESPCNSLPDCAKPKTPEETRACTPAF